MSPTDHDRNGGDETSLVELALGQAAILSAVFGFAFLLIKITRVSHLNIRTSHALLAAAGPVEIVLGELVNHLPWILFVISALGLWWAVGAVKSGAPLSPAHMGIGAVTLFAVLLMPWPLVAGLAGVVVVRVIGRRPAPGGRSARRYYVLVGAVAVLMLVDSDVWLPPETFLTTNGASFVGYSLREAPSDEAWVVVLREEDRSVVHIRLDEISERAPCRLPDETNELESHPSLLQIAIGESADLPEPLCAE